MQYAIFEEFFNDVEKKLNRVSRKCEKYGNPFVFNIVGEEIREVENTETKELEYYKFIIIDIEGTAKIDNWEAVAVLEVHASGNIIRRINTEIKIPERFKNTKNICEHCNSKRSRKNLYVIHNVESDEWKQVGGDCLKLYTNGLSMEYVVSYLDGITELEKYDGVIGGGFRQYYPVEDVIGYAYEVIAKTGYFNSYSDLPTKFFVRYLLFHRLDKAIEEINQDLFSQKYPVIFSQKDFEKEDTKPIVEKIIEYYNGLEDTSEFIHNVKVMLSEGYVTSKNIGFLCYLPEGYAKHVQKEKEKAKRMEELDDHFGEVGKRYKDCNIEYLRCLAIWENQFGITHLYKIVLKSGHVLTWKTNNSIFLENDEKEEFDKITFTVKKHGEYNGKKQTEVSRCKITIRKKEE